MGSPEDSVKKADAREGIKMNRQKVGEQPLKKRKGPGPVIFLACCWGLFVGLSEAILLIIKGNHYGNEFLFIIFGGIIHLFFYGLVGVVLSVIAVIFFKGKKIGFFLDIIVISICFFISFFIYSAGLINIYIFPTDFSFFSIVLNVFILFISIIIAYRVLKLLVKLKKKTKNWNKMMFIVSFVPVVIIIFMFFGAIIKGNNPGQTKYQTKNEIIKRPNILFILIDALRFDHIIGSGYHRDTNPFINSLGKKGYFFNNAIAQSSHTKVSTASIFTGLYPYNHNVFQISQGLSNSHTLITESLKEYGYSTAIFSANSFVSPVFGFDQGVDYFYAPKPAIRQAFLLGHILNFLSESGSPLKKIRVVQSPIILFNSLIIKVEDILYLDKTKFGFDANGLNEAVFSYLEKKTDIEPYFLYMHYMEPHSPYDPPVPFNTMYDPDWQEEKVINFPEEYRGKILPFDVGRKLPEGQIKNMIAQYDGEIRYCDSKIKQLYNYFDSKGLLENTLIIITSDHGEEFYDHKGWYHGHSLYQELIHVPLIFFWKNKIKDSKKINELAAHIDIFPYILNIISDKERKYSEGIPFMRNYVISEFDWGGRAAKAIINDAYKYISISKGFSKRRQLFDLVNDSSELKNIINTRPETANSMEGLLNELKKIGKKSMNKKVKLDKDTLEKLKSLGYVK